MSQVFKVGDQPQLIETNKYPEYAKFPFPSFNPVQSRVFEFYNQDCNAVIAAATSAGKTVVAEMFAAYEINQRGGKMIYLAPLKALAQEKVDDWTDEKHHFSKFDVAICTGDYRLTPDRKKELESAKVLIFSNEMLNSRVRNFESEHNEFLKEVGTVIVDESHLLTVPGRGDHLEVALMKFTKLVPNARIIFLSATMPNVEEIAEWLSSLNGKNTYLLTSKYRPCPLGIHYETYDGKGTYDFQEREKVELAMEIVEDYKEDQFLIFAHTKRTGEMMKKHLINAGYTAEFHSADLVKEKRIDLENRFKTKKIQCLVATSTVAWGCNLPARRVIILGVHRGLSEVDTYDIWQMVGRSGRPGYDPRGDAYILLPYDHAQKHMERLSQHQPIQSRLLDFIGTDDPSTGQKRSYKTLAFHLVSEIHHGTITNDKEIHDWYHRSLANYQSQDLEDEIVDSTVELLMKCGAIKKEEGNYKVTVIGMISSMFYYSPFDVADFRRNFKSLFDKNLQDNDLVVSICLGNIDSLRMGIVNKAERGEMFSYAKNILTVFGEGVFNDSAIKSGFAYYSLLLGRESAVFGHICRTFQWDFPRTIQVLMAIDSMSGKWNQKEFFKNLQTRIAYGVKKELVELCSLPDVGRVRAERLFENDIKSVWDVASTPADSLARLMKISLDQAEKIRQEAKANSLFLS